MARRAYDSSRSKSSRRSRTVLDARQPTNLEGSRLLEPPVPLMIRPPRPVSRRTLSARGRPDDPYRSRSAHRQPGPRISRDTGCPSRRRPSRSTALKIRQGTTQPVPPPEPRSARHRGELIHPRRTCCSSALSPGYAARSPCRASRDPSCCATGRHPSCRGRARPGQPGIRPWRCRDT
jgi:hypothetical protein